MRPVPNIPLLWIALVVVVPASSWVVYAAGDPQLGVLPGVAAILAFVLSAVLDIVRSTSRLAGLSVTVPDLLRCTKGRELPVPVTFANRGATIATLRYGIATPVDFRVAGELIGRLTDLEEEKRFLWLVVQGPGNGEELHVAGGQHTVQDLHPSAKEEKK